MIDPMTMMNNYGGGQTAEDLLNGTYQANYGNVFDSGTGALDYFPSLFGFEIGSNPYAGSPGGWINEGWDEDLGGFGSFNTDYNYPVGEAGGYGW